MTPLAQLGLAAICKENGSDGKSNSIAAFLALVFGLGNVELCLNSISHIHY